jgi:hypothetical protein
MKQLTSAVIAALAVFFATYLLGAFMSAEFNIAKWVPQLRVVVAVFGALFSVISFGISMQ